MPSETLAASWHPALMPNSFADVIETKGSPVFGEGALPAEQQTIEPSSTEASGLDLDLETLEEESHVVPTKESNRIQLDEITTHNDLDNLRNALTTSLSSPGGVELEEAPVHNGIDGPQPAEEDKAEFPSEGPKHENKHLSTMSFARTVSEDVNWGEDDDVDPEWNIQRTDTDPFKLMARSDRTNSFPAVPPIQNPAEIAYNDEPQAHSQVEAIMNEVAHEPQDFFGDDTNHDDATFFNQPSGPEPVREESKPTESNGIENDAASSYGQSYGGDYRQDEDQESQARFEEGIPLVHPESSPRNDYGTPAFLDEADEEDDFFSQVAKADDSSKQLKSEPGPLERKSTFQVMDSMHYQPNDQLSPALPEEHVENSTGDPAGFFNNQPENKEASQSSNVEVDLAEKWKAALAGDEFLDDDDDELLPDDDEPGNNSALDPAALFGSDDEGFLEDTDGQNGTGIAFPSGNQPAVAPVNGHIARTTSGGSRYLPAGATTQEVPQPRNNYAPSGPLLTDLSRPAATSTMSSPYIAATSTFPPQQQLQPERPGVPKAQSFANQSKGGYSSPYDLPMEVVKPRKRPSMQNIARGNNASGLAPGVPPPRSSSMYAQAPPPRASAASLSPPTSSNGPHQNQQQPIPVAHPPRTNSSNSGFFEDLPMASRPKPAPRHSHAAPGSTPNSYGPPATSQFPPNALQPPFQPSTQHQPPPPPTGLVAPERVSPYAALPTNHAPPPAIASRYSPAPPPLPHSQTAPPPMARFSPAPPPPMPRQQSQPYNASVGVPSPPVLPHQPRTSSPLAHFERNHEPRSYGAEVVNDRRSSSSGYESNLRTNHLPPTQEVDENEQVSARDYGSLQSQNPTHPPPPMRMVSQTPPPQNYGPKSSISPSKRGPSSYLPQQPSQNANQPAGFVPPQRSMTQSPSTAFTGPRMDMAGSAPYQRPASVEVPTSPRAQYGINPAPVKPAQGRSRGFSQAMNYVTPTDGREHDPLQRWKGSPVFVWGVGGTIMTSFPKDVPRYGMNQSTPTIIRSPGEVKIRNIKDVDPLQERLTSFPGPLKGKSKKKDVISWLTAGIQILEGNASYLRMGGHLSHEDKRTEERILLWKILLVFIENDGALEGNPVVDKAVRAVLSPGLDSDPSDVAPLYATGADLSGISHSSNSAARSDPVDPTAVDQLRKHLLRGEREKAVWEAVDKRLWAHAMLISNTVSKELYKQVAQEFVQKEVKNTGENTESLAALYEVFAGNFEESIDELVPPSARAGFQMVSTSNSAGPSKDAMDGLDRWRETLGLVLSNRSIDDVQALKALGKLLSGYGRAEAAHICFLFARSVSIFGGIDDPLSNIVLVGSDHLRQPYEFDKEMEPILLSEVFEYGMSLSSTASVAVSYPHLSIYKMQHATILAEYGYRENALQYCESVASSITSQTRISPYHHSLLISALDDLRKRLKQSPKSEASSWLSKPSIDKVSGSVWDKLSKFVAGDENDTPDNGTNATTVGEIGPFSRIAGGTPTISRSPSNAELYGSYNGGLGINGTVTAAPATKVSSRYAPGRAYTPDPPRSGSLASQPRTSMEERSSGEYQRRSGEHQRYESQRNTSDYRPGSQSAMNNYSPNSQPAVNSFMPVAQQDTPQSSYTPFGFNDSPYSAQLTTPVTEQGQNMFSSPQPLNNFDGNQMTAPYTPPEPSYGEQQSSGYEPPASSGYEPPSGGYEPPSSSYTPYEPTDEPDSPVDTKPKKKSFMDDDYDDGMSNDTSAPREKTKAEKDREADEAFRKAAEADAAKLAAVPAKKGWGLGGWFGGGKKETADATPAQSNKPIRAKLGEASSFYYDPDLKRWVNKKGGDTAPTPSATPPPPRAGPPRTASGPPNSGPTSTPRAPPPAMRAVSDAGKAPGLAPGLSQEDGPSSESAGGAPALAPPGMAPGFAPMSRSVSNSSAGRPPSAPPSRPGTSMSNASSIDDLMALPAGGRKGTAKKKKGRGYIDVMGEKPSS